MIHLKLYEQFNNSSFKKDGELTIIGFNDNIITKLDIEISDTPEKRSTGLMYRKSLPKRSGMFFIFDNSEKLSFWMKNTIMPLDIIFINSNMVVVDIYKNAEPYSLKKIIPSEISKYVLEVPAGFALDYGIKRGYEITCIDERNISNTIEESNEQSYQISEMTFDDLKMDYFSVSFNDEISYKRFLKFLEDKKYRWGGSGEKPTCRNYYCHSTNNYIAIDKLNLNIWNDKANPILDYSKGKKIMNLLEDPWNEENWGYCEDFNPLP